MAVLKIYVVNFSGFEAKIAAEKPSKARHAVYKAVVAAGWNLNYREFVTYAHTLHLGPAPEAIDRPGIVPEYPQ